ncbi:MAG: STAS domain-containing protein [Nitrososphaerales archaeon]
METLEEEGPPLGTVGSAGRGAVNDACAKPPGDTLRAAPADPPVRAHTLILTGELNHRSAYALEAEIERLCGEDVKRITLDLRQLVRIDSIGVAVIAFRCRLSRRQGLASTLIAGPQQIHRAFERAGVVEMLPFEEDDIAARRRRASPPGQRLREGCEQ